MALFFSSKWLHSQATERDASVPDHKMRCDALTYSFAIGANVFSDISWFMVGLDLVRIRREVNASPLAHVIARYLTLMRPGCSCFKCPTMQQCPVSVTM